MLVDSRFIQSPPACKVIAVISVTAQDTAGNIAAQSAVAMNIYRLVLR